MICHQQLMAICWKAENLNNPRLKKVLWNSLIQSMMLTYRFPSPTNNLRSEDPDMFECQVMPY